MPAARPETPPGTTPEGSPEAEAVGHRHIAGRLLRGLIQGLLRRRRELRYQLIREWMTIVKRFAAGNEIANVDIRELPQLRDRVASGYVDDRNRAVLAALCEALDARSFFEIGTNRGRTAWSVARSVPGLQVHTLDLPDPEAAKDAALGLIEQDRGVFKDWQPGIAYRDTPEESRIESLQGDSATFDYAPYAGKMDVVLIDGSHAYPYVRSDTDAALRLLSSRGAIVWDDYPAFPSVFKAVLEASRELEGPVIHILGTRLAVWSRVPLRVEELPEEELSSAVTIA